MSTNIKLSLNYLCKPGFHEIVEIPKALKIEVCKSIYLTKKIYSKCYIGH